MKQMHNKFIDGYITGLIEGRGIYGLRLARKDIPYFEFHIQLPYPRNTRNELGDETIKRMI